MPRIRESLMPELSSRRSPWRWPWSWLMAGGLLASGHSFAQAVDDQGMLPAEKTARKYRFRSGGQSSSSRSTSGPFSRPGVTAATDRPSRKVACDSMRVRPFWPAARPARPSFPAIPRIACWSTPSTMARPTTCPPNRSFLPEEIATLTEWVQRGAPWGIGTPNGDRILRRRQDSRGTLERRIRERAPASGAFNRSHAPSAPASESATRELGAKPDRSFHPGRARAQKPGTGTRSRQANIDPPPIVRPDRPSPRA